MSNKYVYDIFISHAFEDKNPFVNELASALDKTGLKVWYSGHELKIGDSIAECISKALSNARFGIVVISPVYLEKKWAMNELNTLLAQETKENRILPILHHITISEVKTQFPILADRYSIPSTRGIDFIINKIIEVAKKNAGSENLKLHYSEPKSQFNNFSEKENEMSTPKIKNTNNNTVNVNSGNSKTILIIILILATIGLYIINENSDPDPPKVNKENSRPSISN